jgi:ribosomal protein S12 methylthiotransferase accessory factor
MESIELWHAEYARPAPDVRAVPAAELGLPYRLEDVDHDIGSVLTDRTSLDWILARGVSSGHAVPVPVDTVRLSIDPLTEWQPRVLRVSSNGLASGNSADEATLHAAYEAVERDVLRSLTDPTCRATIDTATVDDPVCRELIDRVNAGDVFLEVFSVTSRLPVPCFAAFVWSEDVPVLSGGSGAHSSVGVAMSRAITEAVQSRLTAISGVRDDLAAVYTYVHRGSTRKPTRHPNPVDFRDATAGLGREFADVRDEVEWLSGAITGATGAEPLRVELSTMAEFSVAKVVCPGLYSRARHNLPWPAATQPLD